MSKVVLLSEEFKSALRAGEPFRDSSVFAYVTRGGTYMIASPAHWNDNGKPRDLLMIRKAEVGSGGGLDVIELSPLVHEDFAPQVRAALAQHRWFDVQTGEHESGRWVMSR